MQSQQPLNEQTPEQSRQNPHMQKEPRLARDPALAIWRQPTARNDHVDVRMMGQRRSPSVQNAGHADLRAEALGIGGDGRHRLGRCLEQQAIDGALVPICDTGDLGRQGEDQVEVFHGQQIFGSRRHPVARRRSLTFGTVPVLARVVGDVLVIAFGAGRHMPAERLGSAGLNGGHHFELAQADMTRIGPPPRRAIAAKDVSDLQRWLCN